MKGLVPGQRCSLLQSPPQTLSEPLTIRQQPGSTGVKRQTSEGSMAGKREGEILTASIFYFEKTSFDTLSKRILIHLHTLKSQFPNAALPRTYVLPGKKNSSHITLLFLFLEHLKIRFLFFFPFEATSP